MTIKILALSAWLGLSAITQSQPLEDLITKALENSPQIQAAQRRCDAARIRAGLAGAVLNPSLQLGQSTLPSTIEETVSLGQNFELSGQPGLRKQLACLEWRLLELKLRETKRNLTIDISRAYLDLWQAQQVLAVSQKRCELFDKFNHIARRRYEVGDIAANQRARVALESKRAQADLAATQGQFAQARVRLQILTDQTLPAVEGGAQAVPEAPIPAEPFPSLDSARACLESQPDFRQAQLAVATAELESQLAERQGSPQLGLLLYRSNLVGSQVEHGARLVLSWTPWDYGQISAEVVRKQGEKFALEADVFQVRRQLEQRLQSNFFGWQGARHKRDLLQDQVLEALRLAEAAQKGFEAGFWSLQDTLDAQRVFREAQIDYLAAECEQAKAWVELQVMKQQSAEEAK